MLSHADQLVPVPPPAAEGSQHGGIVDGSFAVLQKVGGEQMRLCRLQAGQKVLIERLSFDPKDAVGLPFGMFQVSSGGESLTPVLESEEPSTSMDIDGTTPGKKEDDIESKNSLNSDQSVLKQQLSTEEIMELKESGVGTTDLVSKLVSGNLLFNERTTFSKRKYVRKKSQKHSDRVLISRPSIRLLCQSYFRKDPDRIAHLRLDQLGLIIQLSAVHSGNCNVLVYEQALGLVGAALVERLAGRGNCIFLHKGDWPQSIPCIEAMNFSEQNKNTFLPLRITTLLMPELLDLENNSEMKEKEKTEEGNEEDENILAKKPKLDQSFDNKQHLIMKRNERRAKEHRALELVRLREGESEGHLDAICLVSRTFDPVDALVKLFPALRLSGSVVIYSPVRGHLIRAWHWLRSSASAVDIQLSRHFHRAYQVLPNSTHPLMQQPVSGGYVLHAIKVLAPRPVQQQQRQATKATLQSGGPADAGLRPGS